MSNHINVTLLGSTPSPAITLLPSSSAIVDFDLEHVADAQMLVEVTYPSTSSTTGVSLSLYMGFGTKDPLADESCGLPKVLGGSSVPVFSDSSETVVMQTITPSSATPVTKRTAFYLSDIGTKWPRWIRMVFTNVDASKTATIKLYADL